MFLLKLIGSVFGVVAGALAGNWAGSRLATFLTGKAPQGASFVQTNAAGETVVAISLMRSRFLPAALLGLAGRPRWLFAFLGGVLSSGLLPLPTGNGAGKPR